MIGKVFGWLGRKAVLYCMLVVAIAAGTVVIPWMKAAIDGNQQAVLRKHALDDVKRSILIERDEVAETFRVAAQGLQSETTAQLDARREKLVQEKNDLEKSVAAASPAWLLAVTDQQALLTNERAKLRIAVIDQELGAINAARQLSETRGASLAARADVAAQKDRLGSTIRRCDVIRGRVQASERDWRWRLGGKWIESAEHRRLVQAAASCREEVAAARSRYDRTLQFARTREALQKAASGTFAQAVSQADRIESVGSDLAALADQARISLEGTFPEKVRAYSERFQLPRVLAAAGISLALIIATPFLIRLFCYFVLAPLAMRRGAIRLRLSQGTEVPVRPAAPSATSVAVRLAAGEELLVRQDYLQTSSHASVKGTQWWLDWRKPITSFATGLTFLTRIRGDGEATTISATRDGLAEVTILSLPEGAACVIQPRILAAVAQPVGRRLRITSHWRLGSLNAWLTMQLRYLVFHGPARLVLKGSRGVRVEAAEKGRIFGQDQLVGFSAELAYSVTRTETFWPYFLGREQLLKDRVMEGNGVLIVEEAPLAARRGEVRRGLEGMIDAGMKVFGM